MTGFTSGGSSNAGRLLSQEVKFFGFVHFVYDFESGFTLPHHILIVNKFYKELRACPHKRLRGVAMLEIFTLASSDATDIS